MINLDSILDGVRSVGICGHVKPDGDAYGSCMGLYLFLKACYPEVKAEVYLEDSYSETFRFIACSEEIIHDYPQRSPADVFFALDSGDLSRIGRAGKYFDAARKTVVIDHHISNPGYGMINEIQPDASSTSELIALMIRKERITKEIAEALYMGIAHDTGVFQYSCTSSRTMMVTGWLMDQGIDFSRICDETYYLKTWHQNLVLAKALSESRMILDGKMIWTVLTLRDMEFYQVQPKDLDGIVQQLHMTRGVEAAVFLYETEPECFKVSLRSNGQVDVSRIALHFGGGGHVRAAGCTMVGKASEIMERIARDACAQSGFGQELTAERRINTPEESC